MNKYCRSTQLSTIKERAVIKRCIICGSYCTHEHHLVKNGSHTSKNKVPICMFCHRELHENEVQIPYSRLSDENKVYILDREVIDNTISED